MQKEIHREEKRVKKKQQTIESDMEWLWSNIYFLCWQVFKSGMAKNLNLGLLKGKEKERAMAILNIPHLVSSTMGCWSLKFQSTFHFSLSLLHLLGSCCSFLFQLPRRLELVCHLPTCYLLDIHSFPLEHLQEISVFHQWLFTPKYSFLQAKCSIHFQNDIIF